MAWLARLRKIIYLNRPVIVCNGEYRQDMNKENFTEYLKEVANLYKISYEELKTLVVEYPYCQNLHHLLLEKSKLDDNDHLEENLQRAATYSSDRAYLFYKLKQLAQPPVPEESVLAREEYLELPDLNNPGHELPQLVERSSEKDSSTPLALTFIREEEQPWTEEQQSPTIVTKSERPLSEPDRKSVV